jgi:hypothetical protein
MSEPKRPPTGLSTRARKLWADTCEVYDLDEHEFPILEAACRELDLIARLEKELKGAPLMVRGSQGQDVANPLLGEVRMHRKAYIDFIGKLELPESDGVAAHDPRRAAAQKAANARWSRGA